MNKVELVFLVIAVALALTIGAVFLAVDSQRDNAPDTDGNVGRCLQAQVVLYRVERGDAAEKCLTNLHRNGAERFARTWANYETEVGSW